MPLPTAGSSRASFHGESDARLTLVDAEGRSRTFRRSDVEGLVALNASLMPGGLAAALSPAEFADLAVVPGEPPVGRPGDARGRGRRAGPLPAWFRRVRVATGVNGATAMEVAPDGRVFVCEQTGSLRVVKGGAMLAEPFLRVAIDADWELGLLGVALDPDFACNGFVYVCGFVRLCAARVSRNAFSFCST